MTHAQAVYTLKEETEAVIRKWTNRADRLLSGVWRLTFSDQSAHSIHALLMAASAKSRIIVIQGGPLPVINLIHSKNITVVDNHDQDSILDAIKTIQSAIVQGERLIVWLYDWARAAALWRKFVVRIGRRQTSADAPAQKISADAFTAGLVTRIARSNETCIAVWIGEDDFSDLAPLARTCDVDALWSTED